MPDISPNGNWVAFVSLASTIVENDTNAASDLFLWNRITGEATRASVAADGAENPASSAGASITDQGEIFSTRPGRWLLTTPTSTAIFTAVGGRGHPI